MSIPRTGYRQAIEWIAENDDTDLGEESGWLVTINLVADIWGKTPDEVGEAVLRYRRRMAL